MIKNAIANMSGQDVAVNADTGEDAGLVVATRPHKIFEPKTQYFINSTYGREMNKNAVYGGGVLIADGDTTPWTMTQSAAQWTEDSTDRFYDTAKSVKCAKAAVGDTATFTNQAGGAGTDIDISNYEAFTMWINVDAEWGIGDEVLFQGVVDGGLVGNSVDLSDYFDYTTHDVWQLIDIPKEDVGLAALSIDAVQFTQGARGGGKTLTFYLDLITLEETGTPISYSVKPSLGKWFHIKSYQTCFVDAFTGLVTTADGTESHGFPGLSYNKILGMTPTEGYLYERYRDGELVTGTSWQINNLGDMLSIPNTTISNAISDGTNTLITIAAQQPDELVLKSEENDELRITIRDDFSALLQFRVSCQGYEETR